MDRDNTKEEEEEEEEAEAEVEVEAEAVYKNPNKKCLGPPGPELDSLAVGI